MNQPVGDNELVVEIRRAADAVRSELAKCIVGQKAVIDDLLSCLLAGGHCLLIGVPGLAKTTLVRSLAKCLDLTFNRIQFTPDLMPSDITGSEILFEAKGGGREFKFVKGPIFCNVVLADEINRTPPKTQSALLQAMQEGEVTSAGTTFSLPGPFWVLATQNPIEQEGTYPLPEAQLDRFMFSVEVGYPDAGEELEIARTTTVPRTVQVNPLLNAEQIGTYKDLIWRVPVADSVMRFAVSLARSTRPGEEECPAEVREFITWGAGPRASQYLILAAKAYAVLDGRPTPDLEDIERAAYPVLRHRLVRSFHAETEGMNANAIVRALLDKSKPK
jgi:MoxR-like ATPase